MAAFWCEGKIRYETRGEAQAKRALLQRSRSLRGGRYRKRARANLSVYPCRECGGFHLGRSAG